MITARPLLDNPFILVFYRPDGTEKKVDFTKSSFENIVLSDNEIEFCLNYKVELNIKYPNMLNFS